MEQQTAIQKALFYIDRHITEEIASGALARECGYSLFHFSRLFTRQLGLSPMAYVTWRKLLFARQDLSCGKGVLETAVTYGFETHAGFTKAFRRRFGYPPSLCRLHIQARAPAPATLATIKTLLGGSHMTPHIIEFSPFSVVGYPTRHKLPHVGKTGDIPTFWNTIKMETADLLTHLHNTFPLSKHFEISLCYDVCNGQGEFTYLLGRGIDNPADLANITPEMTRVDLPGGLYAVFSTPPAHDYIGPIAETWEEILLRWLPQSEFEYDENRMDFEYYDLRDHGVYFGGKSQMDICIPIRPRES